MITVREDSITALTLRSRMTDGVYAYAPFLNDSWGFGNRCLFEVEFGFQNAELVPNGKGDNSCNKQDF